MNEPPGPTVKSRPRRPCDACRKRCVQSLHCPFSPPRHRCPTFADLLHNTNLGVVQFTPHALITFYRKSRCEFGEGESACVLCRFHRQDCTFLENPIPRKKRRRSLTPEEPENTPLQSTVESRGSKEVWDQSSVSSTAGVGHQQRGSLSTIRQKIPIDDYSKIKGPSLLKKTLGLQTHRHSRLVGSTSILELDLLPGNENVWSDIPLGTASIRRPNHETAFILLSDEGTQNREDEIHDLDLIESIVAPHGPELLRLYFRIVHPSFPILHKKVFLEKYERTHREFSPPLLAAVYILALNWWSYSSELAMLPRPDLPKLEKLALKSMSDIIYRPKLSTIQAGLLLLQRPEGDSWALTAQLVSTELEHNAKVIISC